MIRVLAIGPDAEGVSVRLRGVAAAIEVEATSLPAAAVRAFEKSPPDAVLLCGAESAGDRLEVVVAALRERPIGRLVPCIGVGVRIDGLDAQVALGEDAEQLLALLADLVGVKVGELLGVHEPARDTSVTEQAIERKLRQVRHETYYDVLGVSHDASEALIHDAFMACAERFAPHRVPDELARRFADELAEVRDGIEDAFAVLGNGKLRAAYGDRREGA